MTREEGLKFLRENIKKENIIKHMLATEAIMRALAQKLGENEDDWGLAGLLHDCDMEIVDWQKSPEKQGMVAADMLDKMGVNKTITDAIRAHNELTGKTREALIEKAIFCADPISGLIVAATLVLPTKKLSDLTAESVLNRFKEKSFAAKVNREAINTCSETNLALDEFVKISLSAMQKISNDLGL